jgi:UDP-2-acetamido-3-amino-2,3-dideoxy-glucuronate N-acetyltransferase
VTRPREVGLGQIGLGSWGPNLVRTFAAIEGCRVRRVADLDESRAAAIEVPAERPAFTRDYREILADPAIEAVAVATPPETHYRIGREALLAGKHLLVEKPLALTSREGRRLVALAQERRRTLLVGHLLMYHPAIVKMAALVRAGRIGRIRHLGIRRCAFGRLARGCSVLWDLGPHDVSIALMVTGLAPLAVSSLGRAFIQPGFPEVSFTAISLAGGALAHIEESWLAPQRDRQLLAVGERGMLLFDELAADGAHLKHFARSIRAGSRAAGGAFEYLDGGAKAVAVEGGQPLEAECRDFLTCIRRRREPRAGGANAVAILQVLEAAERSQRAGGREVRVSGGGGT